VGISIMTDEFFEDENVDDGENNLEYDRDIFDIEIEFDDEVDDNKILFYY